MTSRRLSCPVPCPTRCCTRCRRGRASISVPLAALPHGAAAVVAAIEATLGELGAFGDAQESDRVRALHSDDFYRRTALVEVDETFPGPTDPVLALRDADPWTPFVRHPSRWTFYLEPGTGRPRLERARLLPDDRGLGIVRAEGAPTWVAIFASDLTSGRYVIDELAHPDEAAGTPAA